MSVLDRVKPRVWEFCRTERSRSLWAVVVAVLLIVEAAAVGTNGLVASAAPLGPQISEGVPVIPVLMKADLRTVTSPTRAGEHVFPAPLGRGVPVAPKQMVPGAPTIAEGNTILSAPIPAPISSFAGLDFQNWGAGHPPDTVGDVGPTYFIQAVNTSLGVFRKSDGVLVTANTLNGLWLGAGTGTACDTAHQGDPTVVYDPIADRWFVADFAFANFAAPPYYECIAVSRSGDPVSGGWYMYALRTDDVAHPWFADYPKMGIWPDGLYMTANMFQITPVESFKEVRVWALNRVDLEAGAALRSRVVDFNATSSFSLLPSNMRTATGIPPAGRENLLVAESETLFAFEVFKFHVDYTGAGSTFTGPANVSQTPYSTAPALVPTPGNSLDSLQERIMMQAQYANLNGVESVWVQHTVRSPDAIQWAQLDVTGGTIAPTPIQQQVYPANDGLYRWMGSLALDRNGDMALGYSVANATTMPDIRYAGRLSTDPLGTLPQTETTLLPGITRGTQTGSCGVTCTRWGDYSAMTLDPDGCTFWYTNEYYATTGLDWQTRIGSFKFANCLTVASVSPASGPASGGTPVTITGSGFTSPATVSFGGVAASAAAVVNATTITTTTPAHPVGKVDVKVNSAGQTGTCTGCFTYTVVSCTAVTMSASPPSPQTLGTAVTWSATNVIGCATPEYKWWELPAGGAGDSFRTGARPQAASLGTPPPRPPARPPGRSGCVAADRPPTMRPTPSPVTG